MNKKFETEFELDYPVHELTLKNTKTGEVSECEIRAMTSKERASFLKLTNSNMRGEMNQTGKKKADGSDEMLMKVEIIDFGVQAELTLELLARTLYRKDAEKGWKRIKKAELDTLLHGQLAEKLGEIASALNGLQSGTDEDEDDASKN